MCNVCKDPECHWGEYCYPEGVSVRRGEYIGKRVGYEPKDEAEHFMKCDACGGHFDMRDLGNVFEHEGPLPHPAQDRSQ